MTVLSTYIENKNYILLKNTVDNIWNFSSTNRSLTDLIYKDIRGKCVFFTI